MCSPLFIPLFLSSVNVALIKHDYPYG